MLKFGRIMALLAGIFSITLAHGHVVDPSLFEPVRVKLHEPPKGYVSPNELYTQDALPLWQQTGPGVYISVGTERGFIGAAYSNATQLLLLDMQPSVVKTNRIIIALLRASGGDRRLYETLRSSPEFLRERLPDLQVNEDDRRLLTDVLGTKWWDQVTRRFRTSELFHPGGPYFQNTRYFRDPAKFAKMYRMAADHRIQAELLDFTNHSRVETLIQELSAREWRLSAIDISNAHWESYMRADPTLHMLRKFTPLADEHSMAILTDSPTFGHRWQYYGANLKRLYAQAPERVYDNTTLLRHFDKPDFEDPFRRMPPTLFDKDLSPLSAYNDILIRPTPGKQRVLFVFGRESCEWCMTLGRALHLSAPLQELREYFKIVPVSLDHPDAKELFGKLERAAGLRATPAFPYLFVWDPHENDVAGVDSVHFQRPIMSGQRAYHNSQLMNAIFDAAYRQKDCVQAITGDRGSKSRRNQKPRARAHRPWGRLEDSRAFS